MSILNLNPQNIEDYKRFLKIKELPRFTVKGRTVEVSDEAAPMEYAGVDGVVEWISKDLFDYQKFSVALALKRKRFAVFADCGLGKTLIFLEWIKQVQRLVQGRILIVSPLMVVEQTLAEEEKFYGVRTIQNLCNSGFEGWTAPLAIINYEKFINLEGELEGIGAVVLDESSILKNEAGVIRTTLIRATKGTPYKLACSATPAPNDREEYANHAFFLEYIRSHQEFFARFFVNKNNGWELKAHAKAAFYAYLASFSLFMRSPAVYGFRDNTAEIPKPNVATIRVELTDEQKNVIGGFTAGLSGEAIPGTTAMLKRARLSQISKGFLLDNGRSRRVASKKPGVVKDLLARHPGEQAIVWTQYNEEADILTETLNIGNGGTACNLDGTTSDIKRREILADFLSGRLSVLITKPKIAGFGLNLQNATVQVFSGLTDSYEQFYQAVRRSYRYGQKTSIRVYLPVTDAEKPILQNVLGKERTMEEDAGEQEALYAKALRGDVDSFFGKFASGLKQKAKEARCAVKNDSFEVMNGDCVEILRELPAESVDFAVFSPPFASLFTYSNSIADMGNCNNSDDEFLLHFSFFLVGLRRVLKPGRIICCHLSQLATLKSRDGYVGLKDFRGAVILAFQEAGFIYFGEWTIAKNPQMQAIKEKVRTLAFAQLESDRLGSKPGLNDMILIFKKPGEAAAKVNNREVSRDEWIEWACGIWTGIRESDTLNVRGTKSEEDVKHVCPMNLTVINRCIRMYSAPGEIVLSPFMGIGSEGVSALNLGRRFLGIELKEEYFEQALRNLKITKDAARGKELKPEGFSNLRALRKYSASNTTLFNYERRSV